MTKAATYLPTYLPTFQGQDELCLLHHTHRCPADRLHQHHHHHLVVVLVVVVAPTSLDQ